MIVREDEIRRPDGSLGIYGVVDKPNYALIIAADGDRLRLVEQFRYPVGERRWEFPRARRRGEPNSSPPNSRSGNSARRPDCSRARWSP